MNAPLTLVTSATGRTGALVVEQLRAHGLPVRALVHRPDARSERLGALGAEVVTADVFDPGQVQAVMRGVRRLYYLPPWHPHMLHSATVFATAARTEGVDAIVNLSQWLASPSHPSLATRQNWLVDQLFDMVPSAVRVTLNPGFFADNYLGNGLIGLAAQLGIYPVPIRGGRNAPPSNEDIARVAVAVLMDPANHAGKAYRPTGPALLSIQEMTSIIADAVGRRVQHVPVSIDMFMRALRVMEPRHGVGPFQMSTVRWYYPEHDLGAWELDAPNSTVRDVAGVEPEDFPTMARRYAARPDARRTSRNLTQAVWDMTRIGFTPTPRLDRFAERQQQPRPDSPILAGRSDDWIRRNSTEVSAGIRDRTA